MTQFKNVLITGAYGGLGSALAVAYVNSGYNLCLLGRDKNKLQKLEKDLKKENESVTIKTYCCDLNDNDKIFDVCENIKKDFDHIHVIVNCAGIFPVTSLEKTTTSDFSKCMQINVAAPFFIIRSFVERMKKAKNGKIINIASSSAYGGAPNTSLYCASKHALLGMSRSLFKELKPHGIRVFCVSPGSIQTPMGEEVEKLGQLYDTFMSPKEVADYIISSTSFEGNMISEEIRLNRMYVQ
jgi:3-oxoacyl-[acyl-carrier protein] reductase